MVKINTKNKEDLILVNKVKLNNCNDSFNTLSSNYENFYFSIAKKYYNPLIKMGMTKEDINVEKDFILYKAIQSFDAKQKTKFSTWFCNCARYHFLNFINSNKKYVVFEDKTMDFFNMQNSLITVDKTSETLDYLNSLLHSMKDQRVKEIFKLRYFSGNEKLTTWNKIARKIGISTQTAINLHEKARVFLKNKIQSKNSFDLI